MKKSKKKTSPKWREQLLQGDASRLNEEPMEIFVAEDFAQVVPAVESAQLQQPLVSLQRHIIYFNQTLIENASAQEAKYISFHLNTDSQLLGFTFHHEQPANDYWQRLRKSSREPQGKQASAAELAACHPWIEAVFQRKNEESRQFEVFRRTDSIWAADLEAGGERRQTA